jgi:two-component system chemotaxis sensor kinase CheA
MAFQKEAFTESFISETQEHLEQIDNKIIQLRASPKDKNLLQAILRDIHTVKGTARMLGYSTIENLSHGIEDVFKGIQDSRYEFTDSLVKLNFQISDCIRRCLDSIHNNQSDNIDADLFLEACKKASEGLFFDIESLENENKNQQSEDNTEKEESKSLSQISSIRIDLKTINELIKSVDNLIIRQFRFKNELHSLKELPKQLTDELQLTEESIVKLQQEVLDLRMLPVSIILEPLKKEIETDAINLGKKINFTVPENSFLLDKVILEQLREIILHIVRNSLDHGIESEEERKSLGKDPIGSISITAQRHSSTIILTIKDDGRGIQFDKVRAKAIQLHPQDKNDIEKMSERELEQFIFAAGFTTKENASHLSGRGVGLDVVRNDLEKIKGRIKIKSQKDKGTTTELTIPLSLASQQGLFIKVDSRKFMIPAHYIQKIVISENTEFTNLQGLNYIRYQGQFIPFYYLSTILGTGNSNQKNVLLEDSSIIILEYLDTLMAVCVQDISDYQNIIVYPLPQLLSGISSLQGVVYDEDYRIVPILNIPFIMQKLKTLVAYDLKKYEVQNQKKIYTALIVDDSLTTRQIEESIFEADGYQVITASDGIDALDKLSSNHVDLIVTDINMPRMDGTELLQNLRRMDEYKNIPVVIVSGLYDKDQEKKFLKAGAQKFIVKSDFERSNLLNSVKELIDGTNH